MSAPTPNHKPLSEAAEDCLKAIWQRETEGQTASTTALAKALAVTPGTITAMLKRLASLELIEHRRYQGALLTESGRKVALEIVRHHRLLELYLYKEMGYSWDEVHDEAEALEHTISEEFEDRVAAMLGHPTTDPHGDPIPPKDGEPAQPTLLPLAALEPGQRAVIARVRDSDPEMLRLMSQRGLVLDVEIEALEPEEGQAVRIVASGGEARLTPEQAAQVFVRLAPEDAGSDSEQ